MDYWRLGEATVNFRVDDQGNLHLDETPIATTVEYSDSSEGIVLKLAKGIYPSLTTCQLKWTPPYLGGKGQTMKPIASGRAEHFGASYNTDRNSNEYYITFHPYRQVTHNHELDSIELLTNPKDLAGMEFKLQITYHR